MSNVIGECNKDEMNGISAQAYSKGKIAQMVPQF